MKWVWSKKEKKRKRHKYKSFDWLPLISHSQPFWYMTALFLIYTWLFHTHFNLVFVFSSIVNFHYTHHHSQYKRINYMIYDILFATRRSCFCLYKTIQHSKATIGIHCIFICVQRCDTQHTLQIHGNWWASMCITDICATCTSSIAINFNFDEIRSPWTFLLDFFCAFDAPMIYLVQNHDCPSFYGFGTSILN